MKKLMTPRGWQISALEKFQRQDNSFLLEACPGAGKTAFSAMAARYLFEADEIDFVVNVVPTTALKGDKSGGYLSDFSKNGVELKTSLKDGKPPPKQFQGAVITYAQLPNIKSTMQVWTDNGVRLMFVFDEVHHLTDKNTWGAAAESCAGFSRAVLSMTGTPFRGDGARISFVVYNDDGVCVPDEKYIYKDAVMERVCRPVQFMKDDGITEYVLDGELNKVRASDANSDNHSKVSAALFSKDSQWMQSVITKADKQLDEYRDDDSDAGGIIICRPGLDEDDNRHLIHVSELVKKLTGEQPVVISHSDTDSNANIAKFRTSKARWICSVRKISEGVDIKRLRVMVMATAPQTELLFRQLVGRVVRQEDKTKHEDSTVYIASMPRLKEFAERIKAEAEAGLNEREKIVRKQREDNENPNTFGIIGASHEDDGAISHFGETFTAPEVDRADRLKFGDPELKDIPVTTIAHLLRKAEGLEPAEEEHIPELTKRLEYRTSINKLVKRIAIAANPINPEYASVWKRIHSKYGVRGIDDLIDNKDMAIIHQVEQSLKTLMAKNGWSK